MGCCVRNTGSTFLQQQVAPRRHLPSSFQGAARLATWPAVSQICTCSRQAQVSRVWGRGGGRIGAARRCQRHTTYQHSSTLNIEFLCGEVHARCANHSGMKLVFGPVVRREEAGTTLKEMKVNAWIPGRDSPAPSCHQGGFPHSDVPEHENLDFSKFPWIRLPRKLSRGLEVAVGVCVPLYERTAVSCG